MSTVNYNDSTPAAPLGRANLKWQSDAAGNASVNAPLAPVATVVTTDNYVLTLNDTVVSLQGSPISNVYLPPNPLPYSVVTIRNAANSGGPVGLLLQGNGHLLNNNTAITLWFGQTITYFYNPVAGVWQGLSWNPGNWIPWAPVITASGGMTLTNLVLNSLLWQPSYVTAHFSFSLSFTLGGTPSTSINVSLPFPAIGADMFAPCWGQAPGELWSQDAFHNLISVAGNNFLLRNNAGANLALGAWTVESTGLYRIG